MPPTPRTLFAAIFAACACLIATAIYMQHAMGLEPCPMCILQRYAFVCVGLVALAATLHGPRAAGIRIYASFVLLFAVLGGGTSIRHSFLQRFPDPATSCGADLDFLLETFPLAQALPKIFAGSGECSKVTWRLLGLSTPEWALVWFVILAAAAAWIALGRPMPRRAAA